MMLSYKTNPYATHQPFLIELLKNTTGNVLELGMGDGSTHVIKQFMNATQKLYSIESDKDWFNRFTANNNHHMYYVDASNEDNDTTGQKWIDFIESNIKDVEFDIVFIDCSPWTARTWALKYFINKAKYVIVHDVDYYPLNNIFGKITNVYTNANNTKYELDFSDVAINYHVFYPPYEYFVSSGGIPTLICSNVVNTTDFNIMMQKIKNNVNLYY